MANFTFNDSYDESSWEEDDYSGIDPVLYWTIVAFITVTGVTGNCLILILFSTERYSRMSYSVYVRALAVSDTVVLISTLIDDVIGKLNSDDIFYYNRDICFVMMIWISFFQVLSSALVLAIAVDRYIAVVHPLRRASMCTFQRAIWVTCSMIIAGFVLCLPAPVWKEIETTHLLDSEEISEDDFSCTMGAGLALNLLGTLSLFVLILLGPFCIVLVLNLRTVWVIRSTSKRQIELGRAQINSNSPTRVTLSLIAVTVASVLVLLPILVVEIVEIVLKIHTHVTELLGVSETMFSKAWLICNVIQLINYAQNFYVFLIFGREYRFVLGKLFGLSRSNASANAGLAVIQPGEHMRTPRI